MAEAVTAQKRFYRTTKSDRWLMGVCGGLARYMNIDPLLVRVLWIILTILSVGVGIVAYLLLGFLAPAET